MGRGRGPGRFDSGRGQGRGGRGGRSQPPLTCPPTALSNILPCSISPNVQFYVYGIDCTNKSGQPIDSRSRRASLFYLGVGCGNYTHEKSLLARSYREQGEGKKWEEYKNEWGRCIYFQNSVLFCRDPLPIDLTDGPVVLVGGGEGEGPNSDNGDEMMITDVTRYSIPVELIRDTSSRAAPQAADFNVAQSFRELTLELRCAGTPGSPCTKTFTDEEGMKRHCAQTGHCPVIVDDVIKGGEEVKVANKEIFEEGSW